MVCKTMGWGKRMLKIKSGFAIHTVDDEETDCNRCDNSNDEYVCLNRCGAEHGWAGYERSVLLVCGGIEKGK